MNSSRIKKIEEITIRNANLQDKEYPRWNEDHIKASLVYSVYLFDHHEEEIIKI